MYYCLTSPLFYQTTTCYGDIVPSSDYFYTFLLIVIVILKKKFEQQRKSNFLRSVTKLPPDASVCFVGRIKKDGRFAWKHFHQIIRGLEGSYEAVFGSR
jgi:hypothetical protein